MLGVFSRSVPFRSKAFYFSFSLSLFPPSFFFFSFLPLRSVLSCTARSFPVSLRHHTCRQIMSSLPCCPTNSPSSLAFTDFRAAPLLVLRRPFRITWRRASLISLINSHTKVRVGLLWVKIAYGIYLGNFGFIPHYFFLS